MTPGARPPPGSRAAGATAAVEVAPIELDQYRANRIEVDDTSAVPITTAQALPVSLGRTLCTSTQTAPRIQAHARTDQVVFDYNTDTVEVTGSASDRRAPILSLEPASAVRPVPLRSAADDLARSPEAGRPGPTGIGSGALSCRPPRPRRNAWPTGRRACPGPRRVSSG